MTACWGCAEEQEGRSVLPGQHTHNCEGSITTKEKEAESIEPASTLHSGHRAAPLQLSLAVYVYLRDLPNDQSRNIYGLLKMSCSCESTIFVTCGCSKPPYLCSDHAKEFVDVYGF